MAGFSNGPMIFGGQITQIDTVATNALGTKAFDSAGNGYIYLQGVASTVAKDVVTFDENFLTTRIAANAVGPVAVAMAAVVANQYGWYQIYGNGSVNSDTTAADKALYIDGITGRVDDAVVSGDLIVGMVSTAADTTNVLPVWMQYPHVTDVLG